MSSRTIQELEEDFNALWFLVNNLSELNSRHQAQIAELRKQAENVKGQAVHTGTGFPLRRFNIDISDEQFATEIEKFAAHCVAENQQLSYENKQLNLLLKEYEQTLEGVMGKFRAVCAAATTHELTLHGYYGSLIQELQTSHSTTALLDSTTLSTLLNRLSILIRAAMRSLNGEEDTHPGFDMPQSNDLAKTLETISNSTWLGDQGRGGGYAGMEGRADWALEREGEIARLEDENKMLRDMLGVSNEVDLAKMMEDAAEKARQEEREKARIEAAAAAEMTAAAPLAAAVSETIKNASLLSLQSSPKAADGLARSASSPAVTSPSRSRSRASSRDHSISLSPTRLKMATPLPGSSPTSNGFLGAAEKVVSPSAPLSALFLRPGGKTKTDPTTAVSIQDDAGLDPVSPTTSRGGSIEGKPLAMAAPVEEPANEAVNGITNITGKEEEKEQ